MWTQGTTQKCVAQSYLLPPLRYLFIYIGKFLPELSLPQAEQSQPSASPLCEVVKSFSHFVALHRAYLHDVQVSLVLGSLEWAQHSSFGPTNE